MVVLAAFPSSRRASLTTVAFGDVQCALPIGWDARGPSGVAHRRRESVTCKRAHCGKAVSSGATPKGRSKHHARGNLEAERTDEAMVIGNRSSSVGREKRRTNYSTAETSPEGKLLLGSTLVEIRPPRTRRSCDLGSHIPAAMTSLPD